MPASKKKEKPQMPKAAGLVNKALEGAASVASLPGRALMGAATVPLRAARKTIKAGAKGIKESVTGKTTSEKTAGIPDALARLAPYLIGAGTGAAATGGAAYLMGRKRKKQHAEQLAGSEAKRKGQLKHLAGLFRKANVAENRQLAQKYYRAGRVTESRRRSLAKRYYQAQGSK